MKATIACAQWPIEQLPSLAAWDAKIARWLKEAKVGGAALCVVPEYAAMELTALLPPGQAQDLQAQLHAMQPWLAHYRAVYAAAAQQLGMTIVAGSFPERQADGQFHNVARVFTPTREVAVAKLQMTRFEREQWGVTGGAGQVVIATPIGTIGVAICYDSEFPLIARRLAVAGAQLLCVPSCTDTLAGYYRVRNACAARALENQFFVAQAPTVGSAPWSRTVDENIGAAAVYGPPDQGLPANGVIAMGELNAAQWVFAELDFAAMEAIRRDGQVFVHRDWDASAHLHGEVTRCD